MGHNRAGDIVKARLRRRRKEEHRLAAREGPGAKATPKAAEANPGSQKPQGVPHNAR